MKNSFFFTNIGRNFPQNWVIQIDSNCFYRIQNYQKSRDHEENYREIAWLTRRFKYVVLRFLHLREDGVGGFYDWYIFDKLMTHFSQ